MIGHEIKIFNHTRRKILNYKKKTNPERLKGFLDESEMNILRVKLNSFITDRTSRK